MNSLTDILNNTQLFNLPDVTTFGLHAILLLLLSQLLAYIYRLFGQTLSNRERLSVLFPILALTTMMIISIIKSSIALSLGLVGALSIVRFRSAIKEPEELAYIFLTISLGLGVGAGQVGLTVIFYIVIIAFIVGRAFLKGKIVLPGEPDGQQLYLHVSGPSKLLSLKKVQDAITPLTSSALVQRVDEHTNEITCFLKITRKPESTLEQLTQAVKKITPEARITIVSQDSDLVTD